jgi:transcriptional regulator with XRE-family HTH domain
MGKRKTAAGLRELFASNMRYYRKKKGLSQEKLAERVDVSMQTITDIECCRSWMSDETMSAIADALEVETFELFFPSPPDSGDKSPAAGPVQAGDLLTLRKELKADLYMHIETCVDARFRQFLN